MKLYAITVIAAAGLLVGCNRSIESASQDFNTLPVAVQKAVRAEAPDAEVARVSQKTENGMQVYEIEFRQPGTNPKLLVSAEGRILNSDGTRKTDGILNKVDRALTPTGAVGTKFSALPEEVQKAIQNKAPVGQISDIDRREENGRVIYEVEFKDSGANPKMYFAEDGTLIQGLQK